MTALDDLAAQVHALQKQVTGLTRPSQLANSSIEQAGETLDLADAATTAVGLPATIAGLQEILDANEETLAAVKADVQAAIDAAQEASDAGVAAGELANEAADNALEKAQEALDAAAAAGGGATYSGSAPTSSTPGVPGQQWFVWDSNYKINAYYVYDGATSAWVQTEITDAVLGNISAGSITSGYLGAERIAAASLTAAVLAADTITAREIGADAILARNIKAAEITGDKIAARTIAAGNIVAGTITGNEIKANSITANQIAANSITATELNVDSLNGVTLIGTRIKTAASGQRLEILNTQIDVYSNSSTKPAGSIYGTNAAGNNFAAVLIVNNYSSTLGYCSFDVPTASAAYPDRMFNFTVSHGLQAPRIETPLIYTDRANKNPVIDGSYVGGPRVTAARFSWIQQNGTEAAREVIGLGGPNKDQNKPRVTASELYYANSGTPAVELPVITEDPSTFNTPDVIVTARDFHLRNGKSIVPAAGTASYNSAVAAGGNASVTVTFPAGQFSVAPVVVVTPSNGRFTATAQSITATGFTISLTNVTSAAGTPGNVNWIALPAG